MDSGYEDILDKAWLEHALRDANRHNDGRRGAQLTRQLMTLSVPVRFSTSAEPSRALEAYTLLLALDTRHTPALAQPGPAPLAWGPHVWNEWLRRCAYDIHEVLSGSTHVATGKLLDALIAKSAEPAHSSWTSWPADVASWLANLEATQLLPDRPQARNGSSQWTPRATWEQYYHAARHRQLRHLIAACEADGGGEASTAAPELSVSALPIGGTVWDGPGNPGGGYFVYEFRSDNSLHYTSPTGFWTVATWSQNNDVIYMETNNQYCEYNGTAKGTSMSGMTHNVTEIPPWPWGAELLGTRIHSGPERINVNQASETTLRTLHGVGPVRATRIIENRPFADLDALAEVLPRSVIQAIADRITFSTLS